MSEQFTLRGHLKGHNGWITSLKVSPTDEHTLVSSSRDKTSLIWKLQTGAAEASEEEVLLNGPSAGVPQRLLQGHSHIVQEVDIANQGDHAVSASWDHTLRLWNMTTGVSRYTFTGHTNDVMSVAFSPDSLCVISGGRDKTVKVWNNVGECLMTFDKQGHSDWVSCVKFSPDTEKRRIVSAGYDKLVKVWDLDKRELVFNLVGHTGVVNTLAISPDGSLCASAGKDGLIILWDLNEGKKLYQLETEKNVNDILFSPSRYWLAAATDDGIKIWDLESKQEKCTIVPAWPAKNPKAKGLTPTCTSICWSNDGNVLFAGYTDYVIRVWAVTM